MTAQGSALVPAPNLRPGLIAAAIVLCLYGGVALSVEFPRAAFGFQSDEATYYMMGHSLAADGDLTYRREDLVRVWREFPAGPSGVFLKRGSVPLVDLGGSFPFVHVRAEPDPDPSRLFYGKSFAYPLVAAPFVVALGTNGFLLLHAILLAVVMLVGYVFLNARMQPAVALMLAGSFLMASVAPAYFVWITPELFNFATVLLGFFCWLYKAVAPGAPGNRLAYWLRTPASDVVAAVLLAVATFSKPSNALLVLPILAWLAYRRRWTQAVVCALVFAFVVAGLFGVNIAITGEWNYQGGDRRTFYGGFPFQGPTFTFAATGMDRATDRVLTEVIFDRSTFWTLFSSNLGYFVVGRYSGLLPYFFPAVFAVVTFGFAFRRRAPWQYLVLAAAVAEVLALIVWIPYNYFGGGGVLGNRYFMNIYGLFLFLFPPVRSLAAAAVPWVVGGLFTAQIVFNPFYASFHPAEHAKSGPLRLLPVELSLVNDLPINTVLSRVRQPFGSAQHRFQVYFLDDNAYGQEGEWFWVKGGSTAQFLVKTAQTAERLVMTLAAGDATVRVTVKVASQREELALPAADTRQVSFTLGEGFPYQGARVWLVSVTSRGGFVPMFTGGGRDNRYLGVRVRPELLP